MYYAPRTSTSGSRKSSVELNAHSCCMSTQVENCHVFLSNNKANVAVARSVGAHLSLAGVG